MSENRAASDDLPATKAELRKLEREINRNLMIITAVVAVTFVLIALR
jgi:hypothetical protein